MNKHLLSTIDEANSSAKASVQRKHPCPQRKHTCIQELEMRYLILCDKACNRYKDKRVVTFSIKISAKEQERREY